MNMSRVIGNLKLKYNLQSITLPFKNPVNGEDIPAENFIQEVIEKITIPEYSQLYPWIQEGTIRKDQLKPYDRTSQIYYLPDIFQMSPIIGLDDVRIAQHSYSFDYGDISPAYGITKSIEGVITGNAYMLMSSQMREEPTFEFVSPNKVKLWGYPNVNLVIVVACEHLPNGETIPDGCYDTFFQLADYDVQCAIYNTLKMYNPIPTAFGPLELNISDFQGAKAERDEFLERYRDSFHLDRDWSFVFF